MFQVRWYKYYWTSRSINIHIHKTSQMLILGKLWAVSRTFLTKAIQWRKFDDDLQYILPVSENMITWLLTLYSVSSQIDVAKHVQSNGLDRRFKSSSRSLKIWMQIKSYSMIGRSETERLCGQVPSIIFLRFETIGPLIKEKRQKDRDVNGRTDIQTTSTLPIISWK